MKTCKLLNLPAVEQPKKCELFQYDAVAGLQN
jgi:hypothetical protein